MISATAAIKGKAELKFIMREVIFFLGFFLYIWLRINPALYNQRQDPVFLLDYSFFRGFLDYPGGKPDSNPVRWMRIRKRNPKINSWPGPVRRNLQLAT